MRKLFLLTILLIITAVQSITAQSTDYFFFDQGVSFYRQKNFSAARSNFLKITSEFPHSKISTASLLMLMRSQYQLKEYQMAEASGNLLIKKFPASSYKDDAYYWLGCIKLQTKQNQRAVLYWLLAYKYADDARLKNLLSEYLNKAMTNLLSEPELDRLANNLDDTDLKIIAQMSYSKILINERKYSKASTILKNMIRLYPEHSYIPSAKKLYKTIPENRLTSKKMLVSIPTSGAYGEMGQAFLSGFKYAYRNSKDVPMIVIDDENSSLTAINEAKRHLENDDVWAIIGSLTDEVSASLAVLSYYNQVPLIS
ncbi:MAG: outer membrane protein assembly factor BamD, partial [Calditrichia bacterium]|nr:outer membrane protein assembly factor BamD [Calditrichia bacterium]